MPIELLGPFFLVVTLLSLYVYCDALNFCFSVSGGGLVICMARMGLILSDFCLVVRREAEVAVAEGASILQTSVDGISLSF